MSVIAIVVLPLIAALLVCIPLGRRWPPGVTVAFCVANLVLVVNLALRVVSGSSSDALLDPGWSHWIAVDGLSALIELMVASVATTAAIYSVGYMGHDHLPPARLRLYYANYNLFVFSMLAIPVLAEPTAVWIVVELTTLCSALLVAFENTREALEAAWKYVVLSLMGAGAALLGFLILFAAMQAGGGGTYTWTGLIDAAPRMPPVLLQTAFVLILIGLGTKVGLVPMHTWLPDAHSQAPTPVCALLSGVETTTILYVILRLLPIMEPVPGAHAKTWALVLGLLSVGVAAFLLLQVHDYKRLFAFSTVEQMGIILTAVGLGASAADYGAMQQIVNHSVTKSFCFFAAGATLMSMRTREIANVRELISRAPVAGVALTLGGLAIAGAPPLALFLSEFAILKAGIAEGRYFVTGLLAILIVIAFFGVMAHVNRMVFGARAGSTNGEESTNGEKAPFHVDPHVTPHVTPHVDPHVDQPATPLPASCGIALVVTAIPMLVLGVYVPGPLHRLLTMAAAALAR